MLDEASRRPARYLFASPTIDLINEQAKALRERASDFVVEAIHSRSGARASVERRVDDLLRYPADAHVVALVTHEALMNIDLSNFTGWHARIDEPPHAVKSGVIDIADSVAYFRSRFELDPISGTEWSTLKSTAHMSWRTHAKDTLAGKLTNFRKLAENPHGLFVKLTSWADAVTRPVDWFSAWTPLALRAFESVVVAGAGYGTSIGYRVAQEWFSGQIEFEAAQMAYVRTGQPTVSIHYFASKHQGSTTFWESDAGKSCLVKVCKWFEDSRREVGFWSGNSVVRTIFHDRIGGERTLPKVAGINALRDHTSCAILYSSKAIPDDRVLEPLFPIGEDEIRRAREDEDIFQFVYRGSIRNPEYAGPYSIYLYSLDQAQRLANRLRESGLHQVEVVAVHDAGLMEHERESIGRGPTALTPEQRLARQARKRDKTRSRVQKHRARKRSAIPPDAP
jgi:hypothetical protein